MSLRSLIRAMNALLLAAIFVLTPAAAFADENSAPADSPSAGAYGEEPVISVFPGYVHKVTENGIVSYELNAAAARDVLRYSAKIESLDDYQKQSADVDFNGVIDAADARALLRYSAKLDNFKIKLQKGQTLTFTPEVGWQTLEPLTESSDNLRIEKIREEICNPDPQPGNVGRQYLLVTPENAGLFTFEAALIGFGGEIEQTACFDIFCDGSTDRSITISRVNYTDDERIYKNSLNADIAGYGTGHMPVYAFDTEDQFTAFKTACADYSGLSLDRSWYSPEWSFNRQTAQYDADFFKDNSLILVYVPASSGSDRFGAKYLHTEDGEFSITIERYRPFVYTCDMSGWFITYEVSDSILASFTSFDAVLAKGPALTDAEN